MKKFLLAAIMLCSVQAFSQDADDPYDVDQPEKVKSYTASNGITYYVGDSVTMGYGSQPNGNYQYFTVGGFAAAMLYDQNAGSTQFDGGRGMAGLKLPIKKIKSVKYMGQRKTYFVVRATVSFYLMIEDAIMTCEVKPCKEKSTIMPGISGADELLKYKKLMDDGVISKEEYEVQKRKILGQ